MAIVLIDNDLLDEQIFADQSEPVEPKIENPHWDRLNTFNMWAGGTKNSDAIPGLQTSIRNGADWFANPTLKPPQNARDVRLWDFTDVVSGGSADVADLLAMVRDYNQANYYYDVANFITYWKIPGADENAQIPTILAGGETVYVPNSYNLDETGGIATAKTWAEWAGPNQTIFELSDGSKWVASFAGVVGNFATAGTILWLMDLRNVVEEIITAEAFQALLDAEPPTP